MIETSIHTETPPQLASSLARLQWEMMRRNTGKYEEFFRDRTVIPQELFEKKARTWLEVGAGTGGFFCELARRHPDVQLIAMERCRQRGNRLVKKAKREGLANFAGLRGNAIPTLIHGVPTERLERIYILYPCPWPKNVHRKNRWYFHPVMPHLKRVLKPGGRLVWASDQKFYIDEARAVCERLYGFKVLTHGKITANPYNDLELFPEGRTKFERAFLAEGQPCYEVIVEKP